MAESGRIGWIGGVTGFLFSFVSQPIMRIVTPIAAAALVAFALSHLDSRVRRRFGSIGAIIVLGLAFAINPLEDVARGVTRGVLSLFSTFLLTVVGYQLSEALYSRVRRSDSDSAQSDD